MKNRRLTIWIYLLVAAGSACSSLAAQSQLNPNDNDRDRMHSPVSRRHFRIQRFFDSRTLRAQLQAAARVRLLEVAEIPRPVWAGMNDWADFAEAVLAVNGLQARTGAFPRDSAETPAQRLAAALSRIAERKSDILGGAEMLALKLQNQKHYTLDYKLPQTRQPTQKSAPASGPAAPLGTLMGIVYSQDKTSAVVDNRILHEGDTIHGDEIVEIHRHKVVFEKNSNKWQQKVRQKPADYWR
jgi:hypothetical protein